MAVTYLIVRHGEAVGNREHRFIGQSDVPLSDVGRRQAVAVGARLAHLPVTAIISSDLQRATNTVTPLAAETGLVIEPVPELREIANGEWNGLLPHQVSERWPDIWERYRGGEDVARPGGERWEDVQKRAVAAIESDAERRTSGDLVVVGTHGGPTMGLINWALGVGLDRGLFNGPLAPVANASVTTLELPTKRLVGINDVGHLDGLVTTTTTPFDSR